MIKGFLVLVGFILFSSSSLAQVELNKIIPVSPNAGSILKFIDMPPGAFTGIPSIGHQIFTMEAEGISIPIGLSYHAGGNKVETIPSFVGLGWALTGIPSITRSVRGPLADEDGGFFYKYNGKTVKELWDNSYTGTQGYADFQAYLRDVVRGLADSESDVFYFQIGGKSGKFFYDQETGNFLTYPFANIKISYAQYGSLITFQIIDDLGNTYYFNQLETSSSWENYGGTQQQETTTTGWYCDKIVNANRTDSIIFGYSQHDLLVLNKRSYSGYSYAWFNTPCSECPMPKDVEDLARSYENSTLNIAFIQSKNARIEFNSSNTKRRDLKDGYSLDTILVFDHTMKKRKEWRLKYDYLISTFDCNQYDTTDNKWMLLSEFQEVDVESGVPLVYKYTYNTSSIPFCKESSAQDFWGFHNGKYTNQNLIPTGFLEHELITTPKPFFGANRFVDTLHTKFGILERVDYPTGGYAEYDFENNMASDTVLPIVTKEVSVSIDGEDTITTNYYSVEFTINNPRDLFMNDRSENGGALMHVVSGGFGCDLTGGSDNCANIRIVGIDNSAHIPIWGTQPNNTFDEKFYLPNGTYKIEATFDQSPANYQSFYILAKWHVPDSTTPVYNRYIGGLRIKEMRLSDSSAQAPLTTRYYYKKSWSSDSTSGRMLGNNSLVYVDNFYHDDWRRHHTSAPIPQPPTPVKCTYHYIRRKSYTNSQIVSHSGAFVGYSKVFEEQIGANSNGLVEYDFFNLQDQVKQVQPYTPYETYEHFRGLPIKTTIYQDQSGQKKAVNITEQEFVESDTITGNWNLKVADNKLLTYDPNDLLIAFEAESHREFPDVEPYQTLSQMSKLNKVIERSIDPTNNDTLTKTQQFYYNSRNLELSKIVSTDSRGNATEVLTFYPVDTTGSGVDSDVWNAMINKNMVAVPTSTVAKVGGSTTSTTINKYDFESVSDRVLLKDIFYSLKSSTPVSEASFEYSSSGKVIEQMRTNNVREVYLWGYGERYPVAKVLNTTHATALTYVNQAILNNPGSDEALRTELAKLRTIPNSQVEYYTYKPLVGVTSITDVRGQSVFYQYDGHNRLALIFDADGRVLKKYCYNYNGQPENCTVFYSQADSANFTRNNCGVGYVGSTVKYVVPAGKYTSMGSQADANAQAQADIDANGQAYANANGTCTQSIYAKLTYENYNYSYSNAVHADVVVRFYSDASCTTPLSVSNLTIQLSTEGFDGNDIFSYDYPETVSGTYFVVEANAELSYDDGMTYRFKDYFLLGGTGYTVVW